MLEPTPIASSGKINFQISDFDTYCYCERNFFFIQTLFHQKKHFGDCGSLSISSIFSKYFQLYFFILFVFNVVLRLCQFTNNLRNFFNNTFADTLLLRSEKRRNSHFLYRNFDIKKVVMWSFFTSEKNHISSQNLSIERNFFQWDGKLTQDMTPILFHRIWRKKIFLVYTKFCLHKKLTKKLTKLCSCCWKKTFFLLYF